VKNIRTRHIGIDDPLTAQRQKSRSWHEASVLNPPFDTHALVFSA